MIDLLNNTQFPLTCRIARSRSSRTIKTPCDCTWPGMWIGSRSQLVRSAGEVSCSIALMDSTSSILKQPIVQRLKRFHRGVSYLAADIRRLRQLEAERTELEAKVRRQQEQLRDAVVSRDATIIELRRALEVRIVHESTTPAGHSSEPHSRILADLAADLRASLTA